MLKAFKIYLQKGVFIPLFSSKQRKISTPPHSKVQLLFAVQSCLLTGPESIFSLNSFFKKNFRNSKILYIAIRNKKCFHPKLKNEVKAHFCPFQSYLVQALALHGIKSCIRLCLGFGKTCSPAQIVSNLSRQQPISL